MAWRGVTTRTEEPFEVPWADLDRAARILAVRSRREASGIFAGSYATAFRGGGMEFDESRPYLPGDDIRAMDWNALARTGEPYVKHYREERDQALLLALDVSASMRFGAAGAAKTSVAAYLAGLLVAAAAQAGDRVGLVTFDRRLRAEVAPARGTGHTWRVIRTAAMEAGSASGDTSLAAGIEGLLAHSGHHGVAILISDFRDPELLGSPGSGDGVAAKLRRLSRRLDLVSIALTDPREEALPRCGILRLTDPERPGRTLVLDSNSRRVRARYRRAWAARTAS
jgi:uncharacterized protein (DUF58 family)